ncbi:MAG: ISKra4 family transposase, partial [Candidatus Bipolaricaulia bacterium]
MVRRKRRVKIELEVEIPEAATLDEMEELIDQAGQEAKRKALEGANQQEGERPEQCHCGGALESKGRADLTVRTVFGTVVLPRHRYRCRECGEFVYNWERTELERRLSRRLRKLAGWCGISWPLERAAEMIEGLTGADVSPKEIQLILEETGREAEGVEEERVEAIWEGRSEAPEPGEVPGGRFYVQWDGCWVSSRERKGGMEGKVAVLWWDRDRLKKGKRGMILEKRHVAGFCGSEELGKRTYATAYQMGVEQADEVVVMGDGAKWIWNQQEMHFPRAKKILDWWHLQRKVREEAKKMLGEDEGDELGEEVVELLWEGGLGEVLSCLKGLDLSAATEEAREARRKLIGYLRGNREGIGNYGELQEEGYLIGTGVVEKGCAVVIVRRQKKQGMVWSRMGAHLVTILRSLFLNGE